MYLPRSSLGLLLISIEILKVTHEQQVFQDVRWELVAVDRHHEHAGIILNA